MSRISNRSGADAPYAVHPSIAYVHSVLANLEPKTGRSLEGWVALVQVHCPPDKKERQAWLKAQGLGSTQASLVAEHSLGGGAHAFDDTPEGYLAAAPGYVANQYSGKKAVLRPLFERLADLARNLGPDVKVCPCETIVPFYRNHVFAEVKPFASRLDLGLALGDPAAVEDASGRLEDTGGFRKKDRITHKLKLASEADLAFAVPWLARAYERDQS